MINQASKNRLLVYGLISAISYPSLVFVSDTALGVFMFSIIQAIMLFMMVKSEDAFSNKKGIFMYIPVLALAFSFFRSDSYLFTLTNYMLFFWLYSALSLCLCNNLKLNFKRKNDNDRNPFILDFEFIWNTFKNLFTPFCFLNIPFKWLGEKFSNDKHKGTATKILVGIIISIPIVFIIASLLSSADIIFAHNIANMFSSITVNLDPLTIYRIILGVISGIYLFGLFYKPYHISFNIAKSKDSAAEKVNVNAVEIEQHELDNLVNIRKCNDKNEILNQSNDYIIINTVYTLVLIVYTLFTYTSIRYLLLKGDLPYGFTYADYARRGFFELLFLSSINIAIIYLTNIICYKKDRKKYSKQYTVLKGFQYYLCFTTALLLFSSFYRMHLYNDAYGLTRLRLLVVIFLVFATLALITTIYYVYKQSFNVISIYVLIFMVFYLTVNTINIDGIIAKNNIDMCFAGEELDADYLFNLSSDAAPQIARLLDNREGEYYTRTWEYFYRCSDSYKYPDDWRSFNISRYRAYKLINNN